MHLFFIIKIIKCFYTSLPLMISFKSIEYNRNSFLCGFSLLYFQYEDDGWELNAELMEQMGTSGASSPIMPSMIFF